MTCLRRMSLTGARAQRVNNSIASIRFWGVFPRRDAAGCDRRSNRCSRGGGSKWGGCRSCPSGEDDSRPSGEDTSRPSGEDASRPSGEDTSCQSGEDARGDALLTNEHDGCGSVQESLCTHARAQDQCGGANRPRQRAGRARERGQLSTRRLRPQQRAGHGDMRGHREMSPTRWAWDVLSAAWVFVAACAERATREDDATVLAWPWGMGGFGTPERVRRGY
jgi:hypothetical protein